MKTSLLAVLFWATLANLPRKARQAYALGILRAWPATFLLVFLPQPFLPIAEGNPADLDEGQFDLRGNLQRIAGDQPIHRGTAFSAGGSETQYYRRVLRKMKHPQTSERFDWR